MNVVPHVAWDVWCGDDAGGANCERDDIMSQVGQCMTQVLYKCIPGSSTLWHWDTRTPCVTRQELLGNSFHFTHFFIRIHVHCFIARKLKDMWEIFKTKHFIKHWNMKCLKQRLIMKAELCHLCSKLCSVINNILILYH